MSNRLFSAKSLVMSCCTVLLASVSLASHAQTQFCGSGSNGGSMKEYPYLLNNNKFGASSGASSDYNCITEYSNTTSNGVTNNVWEADYTWTQNSNSNSVKAFPSLVLGWQYGYTYTGIGLPSQISAGRNVNTSANLSLYGTQHDDVIYDNWILNSANASAQAAEVEVYLTNTIGLTNACNGKDYDTDEGQVTLDSTTYCLAYRPKNYKGASNNWPIYSFQSSNTGNVNQSLNIKDFVNYLTYTKGYLTSSQYLGGTQLGIETYYGKGGGKFNSSSITVQ